MAAQDSIVHELGGMNLGRCQILPRKVEEQIAKHVKEMSKRFHGLTTTDVRNLECMVVQGNNIENNFNSNTKMTGFDWLHSSRKIHNISLRTPRGRY